MKKMMRTQNIPKMLNIKTMMQNDENDENKEKE